MKDWIQIRNNEHRQAAISTIERHTCVRGPSAVFDYALSVALIAMGADTLGAGDENAPESILESAQ